MRQSAVIGITLVALLLFAAPTHAEFSDKLVDRYLESQFEWAMFLGLQEASHYMNYEGSSLKPLTKVAVSYRWFSPPAESRAENEHSRIYEDFWYHKGSLLGSRFRNRLSLPPDSAGAIVIGKNTLTPDNARCLTNAIVRLALDLHFQKLVVDVVYVPLPQYDAVVANMGMYRFYQDENTPESGKQMSIHFRSYPDEKDEVFYLR
jgi:hypothetical protein